MPTCCMSLHAARRTVPMLQHHLVPVLGAVGAHWRSDSAELGRTKVWFLRAAGAGRRAAGAPPSDASSSLPSSASAAARAFFSRLGLRPAQGRRHEARALQCAACA